MRDGIRDQRAPAQHREDPDRAGGDPERRRAEHHHVVL